MKHLRTALTVGAVGSCLLLSISACGSSPSATSSPSGSSGGGGSTGVSAAAAASAKTALDPYVGHPSPFPVDTPLAKRPPASTNLAFLQCVTPICALFGQLAQGAAQGLGVHVTVTKAGASAQSLQSAMSSIIASKPAAVLIPASDPVQFKQAMSQLDSDGTPVVSQGVVDTDPFPAIKGVILGTKGATQAGKLLADWVVNRNGDKPSVFYTVPELAFSSVIETGYKAELGALCPSCKVRTVALPVATLGSTAPNTVSSDLQAHPDTKTAVFASEEAADGLPAALKSANVNVDTVGFAPDPEVLGYIKDGDITAGLGYDTLTSTWVSLDETARLLTGQPLTAGEIADQNVFQFLAQKDITFDPTHGYTGYPDVAQRFGKLWSGAAS